MPLSCPLSAADETRPRSSHGRRSSAARSVPDEESKARAILAEFGEPAPEQRFPLESGDAQLRADALATQLMDLFRRTGDREVFDVLARLVRGGIESRVRSRVRFLSVPVDPEEVVQDALVNVFRYPDRFVAARAGAFRAWSTTIVDNSVRRLMRRTRGGPDIQLQSNETLSLCADGAEPAPFERVASSESSREFRSSFALLMCCYAAAFESLNERERFVLNMVEVQGVRYAELAQQLDMRPEALKMVVFRARRRIQDRLTVFFARAGVVVDAVMLAAG
ncbi:MAG: sigma-70 family RNA polymerase sigma factor [Planctomycetota bacterium]